MSDSTAAGQWWRDRVEELKQLGFDTRKIEHDMVVDPDNASVLFDDYERLILLCEELRREIDELPANLEFDRRGLHESLNKAEQAPDVERRLLSLMATHRPWRLTAKRSRPLWQAAGLEGVLTNILSRLDALDPSMYSQTHDLLDLLEKPEQVSELKRLTQHIEQRQSERGAAQSNMANMLKGRGFEASGLDDMNLADRFERLQELQELDSKHTRLERRIMRTVERFDPEAATEFNNQRKALTVTRSTAEFDALTDRVERMETDLQQRLDSLNQRFNLWSREGFRLGVVLPLLADELLIWEPRVELLTSSIAEYSMVWDRLQAQILLWPDEPGIGDIEFGDLADREAIEGLVRQLEMRTGRMVDDVAARISEWAEKGFDLTSFSEVALHDPSRAISRLNDVTPVLERAHEGLLRLEAIDDSLLTEGELVARRDVITGGMPNEDDVEEFESWLDVVERRNSRHRELLDREWENLCEVGELHHIETASMSLKRFEEVVNIGQRSGAESVRVALSSGSPSPSVSGLMARMRGDLMIWIDSFRRDGWDVSGMNEMAQRDHVRLMRELSSIRDAVENHEKLMMRIERLDWGRDPELAIITLRDLKRPERLAEISKAIPALMKQLASSSAEGEFHFKAWRPRDGPAQQITEQVSSETTSVVLPIELEGEAEDPVVEDVEVEVQLTIDEMDESSMRDDESRIEIPAVIVSMEADELSGWDQYESAVKNLLRSLGMTPELVGSQSDLSALASVRRKIAPEVGVLPRDTRVDRLLRVFLRCMPLKIPVGVALSQLTDILTELDASAKELSKWTEQRLERRHTPLKQGLLENSKELGGVLTRIPSPSFAIPLAADDYEIPSIDEMDDFIAVARQLHNSIRLPKAGMRTASSIA